MFFRRLKVKAHSGPYKTRCRRIATHIGSDWQLFQAALKLNWSLMTLLKRCCSLVRTLALNCRVLSGGLPHGEFLLDIRCLPERMAAGFNLAVPCRDSQRHHPKWRSTLCAIQSPKRQRKKFRNGETFCQATLLTVRAAPAAIRPESNTPHLP